MGSRSAATDAADAQADTHSHPGPRFPEAGAAADICTEPRPGISAGAASGASAFSTETAIVVPAPGETLLFDLTVDVIYHRTRQHFLSSLHRWAMFGKVAGGTVAVSDLFGVKVPAIIGAACGALDLVFDFSGRAEVHRDLARDLMANISGLFEADFSAEACATSTKAWMHLGADEPAPFHVARDLAYNQAVIALGRDERHWVHVPFTRWLLANWWRFEGTKPKSFAKRPDDED